MLLCGHVAAHCEYSAVASESEARGVSGGAPQWRQCLVMLAQEAGLTDGEADVRSIEKQRLRTLEPLLMEMR